MSTYALVKDGVVVDCIVASAEFAASVTGYDAVVACDGGVVGWSYDGSTFATPAMPDVTPIEVVPQTVTMRQTRLALLSAGLLDRVDSAIAAMESPDKEAAQIEWQFASAVERQSAFVAQIAAALELDDEALDNLFTTAAEL